MKSKVIIENAYKEYEMIHQAAICMYVLIRSCFNCDVFSIRHKIMKNWFTYATLWL